MADLSPAILTAISDAQSLDDLRAIAREFSAASKSPNGILFSGNLSGGIFSGRVAADLASQTGFSVIGDTDRAALLGDDAFTGRVRAIIEATEHLDGKALDAAVKATMDYSGPSSAADGGRGFWSQASIEFTRTLTGKIIALVSNAGERGVFYADELPEALSNTAGGDIDGVPRSILAGAPDRLTAVQQAAQTVIGTDGINERFVNPLDQSEGIRFSVSSEFATRLGITVPDAIPYAEYGPNGGHLGLGSTRPSSLDPFSDTGPAQRGLGHHGWRDNLAVGQVCQWHSEGRGHCGDCL